MSSEIGYKDAGNVEQGSYTDVFTINALGCNFPRSCPFPTVCSVLSDAVVSSDKKNCGFKMKLWSALSEFDQSVSGVESVRSVGSISRRRAFRTLCYAGLYLVHNLVVVVSPWFYHELLTDSLVTKWVAQRAITGLRRAWINHRPNILPIRRRSRRNLRKPVLVASSGGRLSGPWLSRGLSIGGEIFFLKKMWNSMGFELMTVFGSLNWMVKKSNWCV